MRHVHRLLPLFAAAALAACADRTPLEPTTDPEFNWSGHGEHRLTFMTRNMYVGTDVDAAIAAMATPDPNDDLPALMAALTMLQHTDFATRVQAMAAEVAANHPQVLAVQEAYELSVIPAGLGLPGDPIQIDFLGALQYVLALNGLNYQLAARVTTTDASVAGGAVRIIDHDALLVDADHVTLEGQPTEKVYDVNLGPVMPGVSLLRGFAAREAKVKGIRMLLISSHLEAGPDAAIVAIRGYQAQELVGFIGDAKRVVLMGDLNDERPSPMYRTLRHARLLDTWAELRPHQRGLTCCSLYDLSNAEPQFYERIDYVWTRGFVGRAHRLEGDVWLVGNTSSDRVMGAFGMIWPSDHAGLVARLEAPERWDHDR